LGKRRRHERGQCDENDREGDEPRGSKSIGR